MASYNVELTRTADKQLRRIAKRDRNRMVEAIRGLADRPRPHGARKLQGYDDVYLCLLRTPSMAQSLMFPRSGSS